MKRKISMIVLTVLMCSILAFSVFAYIPPSILELVDKTCVSADGDSAHASISVFGMQNLLATARLSNLLGWTGDSVSGGSEYMEAHGYACNLNEYERYPATSSRASVWIGDFEIDNAIWP